MEKAILLVDDEENITSSLARLLRQDGYNVLRANSGPDGLKLLEKNHVGVIISDQRMPGMTGVEFLSKVKVLYPDTVRIVLSGYTELSSVTDAINRGAIYKFLTKPWEDDLLRENVAEAFQRHELKSENARLASELQLANDELKCINQELEQRVEMKTRETIHNLGILRVTQEIVEHLPEAIIGIGDDGIIAIANRHAHSLFSAGNTQSLLGEMASDIIPAIIMDWVFSEAHNNHESTKSFNWNCNEVRCWYHKMGDLSQSQGVLLVINPIAHGKPSTD
jgi:FixJ family two-component response regulator